MGTALTVLLNALLVGSLALFLFVLFKVVLSGTAGNQAEQVLRAGALFIGAVIVVGTEVSGTSYTTFIVDALGSSRPLTFGIFGVLAPGAIGAALGWYLVRAVQRSEAVAMRVLALVGMLAAMQFITLYGAMLDERGFELGAAAMPNIAFVSGIFIYLMLKYDPDARQSRNARYIPLLDRIAQRGTKAPEAPTNPFAPTKER